MFSTPKTLPAPPIPAELWMLWVLPDAEDGTGGNCWCRATDDPRGGENYLVSTSKADAEAAAAHQGEMYFLDCLPVRVK